MMPRAPGRLIGGKVVCTHDRPWRELFSPLKVNGAPPAEALAPMPVTTRRFVLSGQAFCHTGSWTNRTSAHRAFVDYWMETTEFRLMIRVPRISRDHDNDHHEDDSHNNDHHQDDNNRATVATVPNY